jgi:hypothetical protein
VCARALSLSRKAGEEKRKTKSEYEEGGAGRGERMSEKRAERRDREDNGREKENIVSAERKREKERKKEPVLP